MDAVTRPCWCGADALEPFGGGYLRCATCTTLVNQGGLTAEAAAVRDDETDYYGRRYWLEHQRDDLGLPDVHVRVRRDFVDRCGVWLATLLRYQTPPARVLEVGAGHGGYTALIQWAGYEATAVDLSSWMASVAAERFGITYHVGPVESQRLEPGSFDAVVANDVLEHLVDPVEMIQILVALLKPDGRLVLQTPEYPSPATWEQLDEDRNLFLEHMRRPAHEHLYLFSRSGLGLLLERAGLRHVVFEEAPFSYDMLAVSAAEPLIAHTDPAEALQGRSPVWPLVLALLDATGELRRSEQDRAARLSLIEHLNEVLRVSEDDRRARLETIERLDQLLSVSEDDRRARLETIERLDELLASSERERRIQREELERLAAEHGDRKLP
jgi:2-polyprenyl-3-methyl-5-hydroxy-6-metoxy-1,4-benzoquinol methylase